MANSRFEIKYLIPTAKKVAILSDIASMTRPDPHAVGANGSYVVRSLYFDSPNYIAYHEKLDGILKRCKFRVRTYAEAPESRYLEIKERFSNRIMKRKQRVDPDQYQAVLRRHRIPGLDSSAVLQEFWCGINRFQLNPLLIIEYLRQPFIGVSDPGLRVTVDVDIGVTLARSLEARGTRFSVLPTGHAILEIKFNEQMPHWVHRLIQKYSLQDIAFSKFCLGLDELGRRGVVHLA